MEEKEKIYEIILAVWNLFKEYGFQKLTDDQWEKLIASATILQANYRIKGKNYELLFRDMYWAVQKYYRRLK